MKKIIALTIAVLTMGTLVSVAAARDDAQGPACADVVPGGSGNYSSGTLNVTADLAAPACANAPVTYTLYVYDDASMSSEVGKTSNYTNIGGANNTIGFNLTPNDDDGEVCVVLETKIGGHVIDRAPDSGCLIVTSFTPGFTGFS